MHEEADLLSRKLARYASFEILISESCFGLGQSLVVVFVFSSRCLLFFVVFGGIPESTVYIFFMVMKL